MEDGFYTFVSYSTRDDEVATAKPFVDMYVNTMRQVVNYVPVFYDGFYVPFGDSRLREYLGRAISDSDFLTALLSPGYVASSWCGFEWGYCDALAQANDPPRADAHRNILPICWKSYAGMRGAELFATTSCIDVSLEMSRGDLEAAVKKAAWGTLDFLDAVYG